VRAGRWPRHAAALVEALHERRLRLFDSPELRQHVARSRFSARTGADRLVKSRSADKIDLAVALAMAVGVRADLEREALYNPEPEVEYELVSASEYYGFEPARLGWDDEPVYRPGPGGDDGRFFSSLEGDDGW